MAFSQEEKNELKNLFETPRQPPIIDGKFLLLMLVGIAAFFGQNIFGTVSANKDEISKIKKDIYYKTETMNKILSKLDSLQKDLRGLSREERFTAEDHKERTETTLEKFKIKEIYPILQRLSKIEKSLKENKKTSRN